MINLRSHWEPPKAWANTAECVCSFSLFCLSSTQKKMLNLFSEASTLRIKGFPRDVRVKDMGAKDEFGELATSIGRTLEHLGKLPNKLWFIGCYQLTFPNKSPVLQFQKDILLNHMCLFIGWGCYMGGVCKEKYLLEIQKGQSPQPLDSFSLADTIEYQSLVYAFSKNSLIPSLQ